MVLVLLIGGTFSRAHAAGETSRLEFDLARNALSEALRDFSEKTSLQLLYEQDVVRDKRSTRVKGQLTAHDALNKLLQGTGLQWRFVNHATVAIYRPSRARGVVGAQRPIAAPQSAGNGDVALLEDVDIITDQRWLTNTVSDAAFGFSKPLLETPRSISFIGEETIDAFSLTAVEDLARLIPGVFTTTRFGIQGSVDVRNVPADTYFRGMKRLTLQGHGRSVLAAMDSIEVVGGPASPLYGMGKIGGYTNVVPKSGRAKSGKYFTETQGFAQLIVGRYDRREGSFGIGGPVSFLNEAGHPSGYYVYGLVEDSDSFAEGVPVKQQLLQAATSIDDVIGGFRLETGVNFQVSRTAGALFGRLTQQLVDSGEYLCGSPLVNLDLNGNGSIGYLEMQTASPVRGNLTANNQPLNQVWAWPTGANGMPLPLDQFPTLAGIPQAMYNYLVANPTADPSGLLRAQGVGGPLPISGAVPVGMVLDPNSIAFTTLNPRHSSAFERELKAQFFTVYVDLIYDQNPDFTVKNQLFFDIMDQYKSSNQPFSQTQDVYVLEDKLTLTKRIDKLPAWLRINSLATLNARTTMSKGRMTLADYSNHRTDAMATTWNTDSAGMTSNTTFASANENADLYNDGLPWTSIYRTEYSELGAGLMFDVDLFTDTNLLVGGRIDGSNAKNTDYAGRFTFNAGASANPGAYLPSDDTAEAWDSGTSWSISLSQQLPYNFRPYVTWAKSSIMLDGNNNSLSNVVIRAGHIGAAELKEVGVKTALMQGRILVTASAFEQGRTEVEPTDLAAVLNAYATATTTRGWQAELKWTPVDDLLMSAYAINQTTEYTPNDGSTIQVDARSLGFQDVVDANGAVVFPAEAFLYGGRARVVLPANMPQYKKKQGNPETQVGLSAVYQLALGFGLTFKGTYLSSTCSGRLCLVELPQSHVYDIGMFWESRDWSLKVDAFNLTNERYFRARTGDTLGDVIAQAMPGRRWQLTAKYKF